MSRDAWVERAPAYIEDNPKSGILLEDIAVPADMIALEVKAAQYAVFEQHGTLEKMHQTYEWIFGVWLPDNGWQVAEADCLEVYDRRFKMDQPDSVFEIWIPIRQN